MARKNNVGRTPSGNRKRRSSGDVRIEETNPEDDKLVDVVEVGSQGRDFFERNRKAILGGVVTLIVLVAGLLIYQTLILAPAAEEAAEQMQQAQYQFDQDSFNLALVNPGQGYPGFLDIIDEYGHTPAGNLANYYAAVSYLNLGKYDAGLDYLKDFDADGDLLPAMKAGVMGDLESELGNYDAALDAYRDAVDESGENYLTGGYYLNKLALLLRNQSQNEEALEAFRRLKREYGRSPEAAEADKYIALLEG